MASRTVKVGSAVGLHARPAAIIAEKADELGVDVYLSTQGEEPVDAASAMLIMTLGAEHGVEVTVESEDQQAVDAIADLVAADLDAE
ncbi:HPr family phosphocarrier protein [Rarobacter incanus]|uniref:Phosphocarrier protein HPr n=1 Tax=Rarobacter incanus TaxID=153494 RepID=A0A542SQ30_9MICO|nr:HPr family phosphocarrier protein [Rarobacter incanus]TQK76716.1 phosphocarrier protein [Rarobacter incanus]